MREGLLHFFHVLSLQISACLSPLLLLAKDASLRFLPRGLTRPAVALVAVPLGMVIL